MPAWTVSCASPARAVAPDCKLEQRLFARESQRLLSAVVIVIPGNTRQPVLYLQLPNGLALQEGVSMSIDAGPVAPPQLQSCDGSGCYATLALSPALLESMKAGKGLTVKATAANRELLTFQHLLADFSPAFESAK
jgi:invasion protein IalB